MRHPHTPGRVARAIRTAAETRAGTKPRRCVRCGAEALGTAYFAPTQYAERPAPETAFYFCATDIPTGWHTRTPRGGHGNPKPHTSPWVDL